MPPKISVIMSVHNGARFLSPAIDSILKQTFADFEFIIVDDCSNDSSPEILRNFAQADVRIKILTNTENIGLTKSLNKATRAATGEYVARIDADDISYSDRLKLQVDFLNNNPNCALVGSSADIINAQGQTLRTVEYPTESAAIKKDLIKYNPFFHSSIMIRKSELDKVGLYNEDFKFAQDYELYFRIMKIGNVANIKKPLIGYREASGSITYSKNRQQIGYVIKAKISAIKSGQYSPVCYIYLWRQCLGWISPVSLKSKIKNLLLG